MAFMEPDIEHATFIHVETEDGTDAIPQDILGAEPEDGYSVKALRDYCRADILTDDQGRPEYRLETGYYGRLSAPGYLDATDYTGPHDSIGETMRELAEMHDICEVCGGDTCGEDAEPDAGSVEHEDAYSVLDHARRRWGVEDGESIDADVLEPYVSCRSVDASAQMDIACGIYWYAADYHDGQGSALYRTLCASDYRPGPSERGPEDEGARETYRTLGGALKPRIRLDNLDHDDGCVSVYTDDDADAEDDQSIDGSTWETLEDGGSYTILMDRPTLADDLRAEGYDVDASEYFPPSGPCACVQTNPREPGCANCQGGWLY